MRNSEEHPLEQKRQELQFETLETCLEDSDYLQEPRK